jgi:hypothetical protein
VKKATALENRLVKKPRMPVGPPPEEPDDDSPEEPDVPDD